MSMLAIKGHATRGKEVIEILEMLGGKSYTTLPYQGDDIDRYYYINRVNNYINAEPVFRILVSRFQSFTFEQFLEKFPYKVGDKVLVLETQKEVTITGMHWRENEVIYETLYQDDCFEWFAADELELYKEETMDRKYNVEEYLKVWEETEKGLEVVVNDNFELKEDGGKFYIIKKQPQYPKTYKECIGQLPINWDGKVEGYKCELLLAFQKLLIARDVYWKIYGEQMGLGKPWKPSKNDTVYCIFRLKGEIVKDNFVFSDSLILEFPTEEMRDVFYENFKDLIEQCKELL